MRCIGDNGTRSSALGRRVGAASRVRDRDARRGQKEDHRSGREGLQCELVCPPDHVCSRSCRASATSGVREHIADGYMGLDIGPKSQTTFALKLPHRQDRAVERDGGLQVYVPRRHQSVARAAVHATQHNHATSIVGSGIPPRPELLASPTKFSYVSTGGGASLGCSRARRRSRPSRSARQRLTDRVPAPDACTRSPSPHTPRPDAGCTDRPALLLCRRVLPGLDNYGVADGRRPSGWSSHAR